MSDWWKSFWSDSEVQWDVVRVLASIGRFIVSFVLFINAMFANDRTTSLILLALALLLLDKVGNGRKRDG